MERKKKERKYEEPLQEDGWYKPFPKVRIPLTREDVMISRGSSGVPTVDNGLVYRDAIRSPRKPKKK